MARRNLHVRLSEEAFRGWGKVATQGGVTLGSLVEAIGRYLDTEGPTEVGKRMIEEARQIDRERRSRGD